MAAMIPETALSSGKPMPRIGLGTASFPFGAVEPAVVREAVLRAVEAGYRHFDTAAVYGTEALLGEAAAEAAGSGLVSSRDDLYITSKLWLRDAHPGRVVPALRKTLQNLKMEYVDMYLIHFPVSMKPAEEWQTAEPSHVLAKEDLVMMDMQGVWEGMEECKRLGLARAIGVSNFSCKKLETLLSFAVTPPAVNQVEVNPHCRQHKVREFCKEKGIQLCGYSPLGGKGAPWANNSVMDCPVLEQIARDRGKTIAQQEHTGSHNPAPQTTNARSQSSNSLPTGQAQSKKSKGKHAATSSIQSRMHQSGHKRRLLSFARSESSAQATAKASAGGSASVVIETNAGTAAGTIAKATINVQGGRASAKIQSSSLGRGSASGQSNSSQKNSMNQQMASNKTMM